MIYQEGCGKYSYGVMTCPCKSWANTYSLEESWLDVTQWRALHSFSARIDETVWKPSYACHPIQLIREALEWPLTLPKNLKHPEHIEGHRRAMVIWASAEWIIHIGDILFERMATRGVSDRRNCKLTEADQRIYDEAIARMIRPGALCRDVPHFSVERWQFWKKRFPEVAAQLDPEGNRATIAHVADAVKRMDAIEEMWESSYEGESWTFMLILQ